MAALGGSISMALSFRELQQQLRPEWGREYDGNGMDFDLLMVPSLTMDAAQMALVTGAHHYEERQLFSLIRLRDPGDHGGSDDRESARSPPHDPPGAAHELFGAAPGLSPHV